MLNKAPVFMFPQFLISNLEGKNLIGQLKSTIEILKAYWV